MLPASISIFPTHSPTKADAHMIKYHLQTGMVDVVLGVFPANDSFAIAKRIIIISNKVAVMNTETMAKQRGMYRTFSLSASCFAPGVVIDIRAKQISK